MDLISLGYFGLFLAAFLSATILPMSSEGILLLMLSQGFEPWSCLLTATIGNSIGGTTNYGIGMMGDPKWFKRFGFNSAKLILLETRIQRYGFWLAFFSWVPFIGDPLAFALGFFRVSFKKVAVLLVLGKFIRYFILILPWT
ncbi:MAG: YqaA family protein [Flavobacteriia bacterium]